MSYETQSLRVFFLFYLLSLCVDTYKHTKRNVACIFLVNFSSNSPQNSKIPRKIHEKYIFQRSTDLNFKNFPFNLYYRATAQGNWTKQTVKKLNLWGKTARHKSTWIRAWHLTYSFNLTNWPFTILLIHLVFIMAHW